MEENRADGVQVGRTATIKDVAELAGVSIATVSRVLNNIEVVNPDTEKKVRSAMVMLNYRRNDVARALKIRSTHTIGFICPDLCNIFFTEIVEHIERLLGPFGYSLVVCSSSNSIEEEKRKISILLERNVDGIVIAPIGEVSDHLAQCTRSNVPLVLIDRTFPDAPYDVVLTDNRWGAYEATLGLIREGFTRIGFLGGTLNVYTTRERFHGYKAALHDNGLRTNSRLTFFGGMSQMDGAQLMKDALSREDAPQAFFIVNDLVHTGASAYLLDAVPAGKRSRIVFASFDYMHYAPLLRFCHYAVAQPIASIGEQAAALIRRRVEGDMEGYPAKIMLKPEIMAMVGNGGVLSSPHFSPAGVMGS